MLTNFAAQSRSLGRERWYDKTHETAIRIGKTAWEILNCWPDQTWKKLPNEKAIVPGSLLASEQRKLVVLVTWSVRTELTAMQMHGPTSRFGPYVAVENGPANREDAHGNTASASASASASVSTSASASATAVSAPAPALSAPTAFLRSTARADEFRPFRAWADYCPTAAFCRIDALGKFLEFYLCARGLVLAILPDCRRRKSTAVVYDDLPMRTWAA